MSIVAYDGYSIRIGEEAFTHSIAISYRSGVQPWQVALPLDAESLAVARQLEADIVLIGTGARQRFPDPSAIRPLIEAKIGFEIMDTRAACRTYNLLLAERRRVGALLLIGET
ncbi:MAG: Mth938-like domain-containing protein [Casimicrobiaceae bacterium]|nr:Mth938-like domain-containing protein [Casimicrobiaceae bacterium]